MSFEDAPNILLEKLRVPERLKNAKINLNCMKIFISYRTVNAPCRLLKPFMVCKEIIATCYENYAAYVNTLCGQDVEIFSITTGGKVHPGTSHEGSGAEQRYSPTL